MSHPAFTIVELLIVIVVIAILAAISIVAYTGIQDKARETAALSLVSQTAKKLTAYQATDTNGLYPDSLTATDLNLTDTDRAKLQYSVNNTTTPPTFCITATEGTLSYYQNTTTQTTPAKGGCNGHGQGGVAAITNLVANPALSVNSTGWSVSSSTGGTPSGARVGAVSGMSSLAITTAYRTTLGGTASSWWRGGYGNVAVTEGTVYTLSGYIRPSVTANTGVIIIWRTAAGSTIIENPSTFSSQTGGTWQRKSVTATAPSGATNAQIRFGANNGGSQNAFVDATAAMFTEGGTLYNYADGNSQGWIWNGTDNSSTSTGPAL